MKTVAIIPARLASTRFPNKVLIDILGLPMIEHVRRRALLSNELIDVIVATCDHEIKKLIESHGGKVIMTNHNHMNGTSRIAEAVKQIDCTHVLLLQADEPLILPNHISSFLETLYKSSDEVVSWNAVGPIDYQDELDRHSFVKCLINYQGRIISCFRRSPYFSSFDTLKDFTKKMLGVIAFKKDFLLKLESLQTSYIEKYESIEQMRIIENGYHLQSVILPESLPSINEPKELDIVIDYLKGSAIQQKILNKTFY